jgi:16S rRNA (guanine527-N7)-methyltransferase
MTTDGHPARRSLDAALEESRQLGFLGPGPIAPQIDHARGFASTEERTPEAFLDLGSGGGLPGLVLALEWQSSRAVLLDAMVRRTEFLRRACSDLGLDGRVRVVCERAEVAARDPELREQFDVVTARSFGPPAVTAECAVAFLRPGGRLVVSEPPEDTGERWPTSGLAVLGLGLRQPASPQRRYVVIVRTGDIEDRFPRRVGVPAKRPLWC